MLIEREVEFAIKFRMRCEFCRAGNWLAAEDYVGSAESMMNCTSCGDEFNFGPALIELTDAEDPALDDAVLPRLAWYHSSTEPEWPSLTKPIPVDQPRRLRESGWREDQLKRHQTKWENQAIHLGTYEAAMDSMLRRMRNQGDQDSLFYLHRVRLRSDLMIERGWRDENSAEAAKVTTFDLEDLGVDGIRYLNAYEAIGSLSLAVVRSAIASTQHVVLPVAAIVGEPDEDTVVQLRALRDKVQAVVAAPAGDAVTPLAKLRQKRNVQNGKVAPVVPPQAYDGIREMEAFAADRYLQGLSPVTREDFLRSLKSPKADGSYESDRAWLEKFMGLAALLTRSGEVQQALASQPWKPISV